MITILSKDLINKIAAGEVVERPASVVKELIENSLDAQASRISIKIKNGGMHFIHVEDNGQGIAKVDVEKLFKNHATSKITHIEDLQAIQTFGFRGEALASIASIGHIILLTKSQNAKEGMKVIVDTANEIGITSAACAQGTSITVTDLFYNLPARRKFMKSERTEFNAIFTLFQEIAVIHPEVEFVLYHNDKQVCRYLPSPIDERIKAIIPIPLSNFACIYDGAEMQIYGALLPPGSHELKTVQYIFVNDRPIVSPLILKALRQGYQSYITKDVKPSFVIKINIDPKNIDVNVHPRKTEVRFLHSQELFGILLRSIEHIFQSQFGQVVYTQDKQLSSDENISVLKDTSSEGLKSEYHKYQSKSIPKESLYASKEANELLPIEDDLIVTMGNKKLLQVANKFIVYETEEGITILDQHAASERVQYEKYMKKFQNRNFVYTIPLFPFLLETTLSEATIIEESLAIFKEIGIILQVNTDTNEIYIEKFDSLIPQSQIEAVCRQLFTDIQEESISKTLALKEKLIASIACRSAIMFGQKLHDAQMQHLLQELASCKMPYTCAHGRPVQVILPFYDLLHQLSRC